eukprot:TRINITY_DN2109_c0_g2_i1.p1 TRINITY_DN2109_c0_g2~~TRINITY_DN2109_c0_g2_i1.p1  ORF type:complete len:209 (-),score=61.84 TRINITY_DN2109_c0_g2_i1:106-732(-)
MMTRVTILSFALLSVVLAVSAANSGPMPEGALNLVGVPSTETIADKPTESVGEKITIQLNSDNTHSKHVRAHHANGASSSAEQVHRVGDGLWSDCGDGSDDFKIEDIKVSPDQPSKGSKVTVSGKGTLKKEITGGEGSVSARYGFIPVVNKKGPIGAVAKLPIKAGPYADTVSFTVPDTIPGGTYYITAKANDQDGDQIFCLKVTVKL